MRLRRSGGRRRGREKPAGRKEYITSAARCRTLQPDSHFAFPRRGKNGAELTRFTGRRVKLAKLFRGGPPAAHCKLQGGHTGDVLPRPLAHTAHVDRGKFASGEAFDGGTMRANCSAASQRPAEARISPRARLPAGLLRQSAI